MGRGYSAGYPPRCFVPPHLYYPPTPTPCSSLASTWDATHMLFSSSSLIVQIVVNHPPCLPLSSQTIIPLSLICTGLPHCVVPRCTVTLPVRDTCSYGPPRNEFYIGLCCAYCTPPCPFLWCSHPPCRILFRWRSVGHLEMQ